MDDAEMSDAAGREPRIVVIAPEVTLRRRDVRQLEAAGLIVLRADPAQVQVLVPRYVVANDPVLRAALAAIQYEGMITTRDGFARRLCTELLQIGRTA